MEVTICERDPEKPSAVSASNVAVSTPSRKQLRRQLAGDLDNIVLTAMRKEPQRRYASAAELSEDLRRHMEKLPIRAQGDRLVYRARKFARRHRLAVATALLVVASLIGGIVMTTLQARRAERRFEIARQLAKSVVADIRGPMERLPGSTALRASMIQTVVRYLDNLAEDPGGDPTFELEIADAYREVASVEAHPFRQNLGQTAAALDHFEKAIAIYSRHADRPETQVHALSGVIGTNIEAGDVEIRAGRPYAAQARLDKVMALATEADAKDRNAVAPGAWVYLYFRLGDAESRRGDSEKALPHYLKALEICRAQAVTDRSVNVRSTLRGAYVRVADAQKETGDLKSARDNYSTALWAVEEAMRQKDATLYEESMLSGAHQSLGNVLGNPEDLNYGDIAGAISHYRIAIGIDEKIAASDPHDVRARHDLGGSYRSFGSILLEEQPAEALTLYERSAVISRGLSEAEPSNTKYRRELALSLVGVGEALHRLGKPREALLKLAEAVKQLEHGAGDPPEVELFGLTARVHRDIGIALLDRGVEEVALDNLQRALAASGELIRRAPSNLYFQRQHANSMEFLGRYYARLSERRPELKTEARAWLHKSLAVWREWTRRKVAEPYAGVQERRLLALITSVDKM
jgi:non-specific serine/threonine protein kinase/serine/threonine-protein kinase